MTRFFKGIGVGTFHYATDLRATGITARQPGASHSISALMFHVRHGTISPYISLTKSFGVARDYAVNGSRTRPSASQPGYVYAIDIDPLLPLHKVTLYDPVYEVIAQVGNNFASSSYQHDGSQSFLLGVVDPVGMRSHMTAAAPQPSAAPGATIRPANLSPELETIVRALRDAEVLAERNIPALNVVDRYDEY